MNLAKKSPLNYQRGLSLKSQQLCNSECPISMDALITDWLRIILIYYSRRKKPLAQFDCTWASRTFFFNARYFESVDTICKT